MRYSARIMLLAATGAVLLWGAVPAAAQDNDGDGWSVGNGDCDDNNAQVYPGAIELCDGLDNDCDGIVDDGCPAEDCFMAGDEDGDGLENCNDPDCEFVDDDGDGYYWPGCGNGDDCNDNDPAVNPGAPELCDGIDNDCDGDTDEGQTDADADGCDTCLCNDCDDNNPDTYPGAVEICDGLDNDCDGWPVYWERDVDVDGFMECEECDDGDATVYPGAEDICDGQDNDCDGTADEDCPEQCNNDVDDDGDGLIDCDDPDCDPHPMCVDGDGDGWPVSDECDDDDPAIHPDAEELCDGIDNNCDGIIDDGCGDDDDDDSASDDDDDSAGDDGSDDDDSADNNDTGDCNCGAENRGGGFTFGAGLLLVGLVVRRRLPSVR